MKERNEKKTNAVIAPELVAKARKGDQAAFTALYEQTNSVLYRSVRSMVHDEDLAWDILQDCYLRAFRSLDKLEADEAFLPWLRRIAVNETARQMSKRRTVTFSELSGEEDEDGWEPEIMDASIDSQPELALDRKESARLVREILDGLPEGQRLVLGMRYYEDMNVKEIADALGIASGTVMAQLFQGRKKVETKVRALEKQGVKLYGLSPLPFLVALLRNLEPAEAAGQKTLAAVLSQAPAAAGTAAGSAAVGGAAAGGGEAVQLTAMTAGQALLHGAAAKLAAGALAIAMIGGGIWAGSKLLNRADPTHQSELPTETQAVIPTERTNTAEPTRPARNDALSFLDDMELVTEAVWKDDTWFGTSMSFYGDGSLWYRGISETDPSLDGLWEAEDDHTMKATLWTSPYSASTRPEDYRPAEAEVPADGYTARFSVAREGEELILVQLSERGLPGVQQGENLRFLAPESAYSYISEAELRTAVEETESGETDTFVRDQIRFDGIGEVSGRYLAKLTRDRALTVSETELAQIRQDGAADLQGAHFRYYSQEELQELYEGFYVEFSFGYGAILEINPDGETTGKIYCVYQTGDRYAFVFEMGGVSSRLSEITETRWLWLEADTPLAGGPGSAGENLPQTLGAYGFVAPDAISYPLFDGQSGAMTVYVDAR